MAAPDNAADLLPPAWQYGISFLVFGLTALGMGWRFLVGLKGAEGEKPKTVVLERAELADMTALRELAKEFKPALEKMIRIEAIAGQTLDILKTMEHEARVAKEVRDRLEQLRQRERRDDRDHRDHGHE